MADPAHPTPDALEVRLLALAEAITSELDRRAVAVVDRLVVELERRASGEGSGSTHNLRRRRRRPGPSGPWSGRRQIVVVAAVVIAIVAGTLVASPRARHAVGDLLGVRGIVIRQVPPAPSTTATATSTAPATSGPAVTPALEASSTSTSISTSSSTTLPPLRDLFLGTPVADPTAAATGVRFKVRMLDPAAVGQPTRSAVLTSTATGVVSFVYDPGDRPTILLTQFEGRVEEPLFQKILPAGATVTPASVAGRPGLWLDGPVHQVGYILPDGERDMQELRLAGPTLLWTNDTVTYRIEGVATRAAAVALAENMIAVPGRQPGR